MNEYFPSALVGHRCADQYRMSFTAGAHSARHVRRIVRSFLAEWGLAGVTDAVELGVTELLANVVRHVPDRRCTLLLRQTGGVVRVEVADGSPRQPVPALSVCEDSESGRGLVLLAAVADKWGVGPGPAGGKTVWFECADRDGTATP
ncbi:ATP-binding protein [Streptomyces sp. NPDC016675]|uniref:ATP-binding protein n=1 Tax=Streptomyces sp. NPDC016675 TaxID=3364970 RepID=UPI0036F530C3